MSSICVATVTYPQPVAFVKQYAEGLAGQSDADFAVLLCDDGCKDLPGLKALLAPKTVTEAPRRDCPFAHRLSLIDTAVKKGFDTLVFCDFDDVMPPGYIQTIRRMRDADFVVSDLTAIDSGGRVTAEGVWRERLQKHGDIRAAHLRQHNMAGFGNTVLNLRRGWTTRFDVDLRQVAVPDWFFFGVNLERNGFVGRVNSESPMRYRSHDNNFVGFNAPDAQRRAQMKRNHYKMLHLELKEHLDSEMHGSGVKPEPQPSDFWWE